MLIFHETITPKQIIGIIVISLGMLISVSDERKPEKKEPPADGNPEA